MTNTTTFEYWPVDENTPRDEHLLMFFPMHFPLIGGWYPAHWYIDDFFILHSDLITRVGKPTHWTHAIPAPGGDV
jgi:hypothetical protein